MTRAVKERRKEMSTVRPDHVASWGATLGLALSTIEARGLISWLSPGRCDFAKR